VYSKGLFYNLQSDSISGMFTECSEAFAIQVSKDCHEVLSIFVLFSGCDTIMVTEEMKKGMRKGMTAQVRGFVRLHLLVLLIIKYESASGPLKNRLNCVFIRLSCSHTLQVLTKHDV